jgi:hypothetical protein
MHPTKMRREILGAFHLLTGRTQAICGDFEPSLRCPGDSST